MRNRRPVQVVLLFGVLVGILAGTWSLLFNSGESVSEAERASAIAQTTTSVLPTTTRNAVTTSRPAAQTTTSVIPAIPSTPVQSPSVGEPDWATIARSVVLLDSPQCGIAGSGTLVLDGGFVLTNAHVVTDGYGGSCELDVWVIESPRDLPIWAAGAVVVESALDQVMDLAVVRIVDSHGNFTRLWDRQPIPLTMSDSFFVTQEIKVIGYPGMGGYTISVTGGEVSGFDGDFVKTDAKMGPGVSGGAAFSTDTGEFLGVPTAGSAAAVGSSGEMKGDWLGWIRPAIHAQPLLQAAKRSSN